MSRVFFSKLLKKVWEQQKGLPDFTIHYWDNSVQNFGKKPKFILHFKNEGALIRTLSNPTLGFGEEYMDNNIEIEGNMKEFMRFVWTTNIAKLPISFYDKIKFLFLNITQKNTIIGARKNIAHHYDLGNDFYKLWLDRHMVYSCAYFRNNNESLEKAQEQKIDHICKKLRLKKGETLLDIGCGWGSLIMHAAKKYKVKALGITLSKEQVKLARERIKKAKIKNCEVRLADYRELNKTFDKIVSVGMFEHVGKDNIPAYMKSIDKMLKPKGISLLHTIGVMREEGVDPWTKKYIFPGGYLPSLDEISGEMGNHKFSIIDFENLRMHYAKTLDNWAERFEKNTISIRKMFDERFIRMWRLYLNSASAGFRHGNLQLFQILFTRYNNNDIPLTRDHIYY